MANDSPKPPPVSGLEDLALDLAQQHRASTRPGQSPTLLDRLELLASWLRQVVTYYRREAERQEVLPGTAEWMLDNDHVVRQGVRQVRTNLPPGYYGRLPKLEDSTLEGYPRAYALASTLLQHDEARVDPDRLARFVRAYQAGTPLTMGELWALPSLLRLGTLEFLAQTVVRAVELEPPAWLDSPLALRPPEGPETAALVGNCIRSLRTIATHDWDSFFESVSCVEELLREDPAGVYAQMDFETRDRYRKVVEELAAGTERSEEEIAQAAVGLARQAGAAENVRLPADHVGYYLHDGGRQALELDLEYRASLRVRVRRWLFGHALAAYLGTIALSILAVLAALLAYGWAAGATRLQLAGIVLFALLPASVVAVNLTNLAVMRLVPPRVLPKMDFRDLRGIPPEHTAVVVIPALLSDDDEMDSLLQQLERHYLGNIDPNLGFVLLTDFPDAPQEQMPEDEKILTRAREGIEALNRRYGSDAGNPFCLLHRRRQWNPAEGQWMGWERKRGKLAEFNRLLLGRGSTSYTVQVGDLVPDIRYVITLDADTILPGGAAQRLVGTLAHPLNQARFDQVEGRVEAGYTVLQPRVELTPTSASASWFSRIYSQDLGVDLYTRAVSDVYQDLFGEGIYVGKGIYDVAAFDRSLEGRVPENALLSHDLFEGIHGRAALVTDIVLYEDYPASYLTYSHRMHRWVRGDWQLLPWLLPRVPCETGGWAANPLSLLDRRKIVDNLRRSLQAPGVMALLLAGWLWLPGSPLGWTLVALASMGVPLLSGFLTGVMRSMQRSALSQNRGGLRREAAHWLLRVVFLPYEATITLDGIVATLHRLLITRKRLLQWTTHAHTVRIFSRQQRLVAVWRQMNIGVFLTLALAVAVGLVRLSAVPLALPVWLAWLLSPYVALRISRPIVHEAVALSQAEQRRLRSLARRTWLFFEHHAGPDDHWLPPDHYQEQPRGLVAHRTSPTNIGLLLLSTLSAAELGYIGIVDMVVRLGSTFEGMAQLERYRGHFLNWYETLGLKTLRPRYVSTVDSGNLAACLLALRRGLEAWTARPILSRQSWQGLADTLDVLGEAVAALEVADLEAGALLQVCLDELHERVTAAATPASPDAAPLAEEWAALWHYLTGEGRQEIDRLLTTLLEAAAARLDAAALQDLRLWLDRVHHHLNSMETEVSYLLPWLAALQQLPPESEAALSHPDLDPELAARWQAVREVLPASVSLAKQPEVCRAGWSRLGELEEWLAAEGQGALAEPLRAWCVDLRRKLEAARLSAGGVLMGLEDVARQAEEVFQAIDFRFLWDTQRQVFYLGYDVTAEQLDSNHYDLLASEARTASLVAIAKGDVPQSHWLHLERPLGRNDGTLVLLSWNGSMFEYLMPALWTRSYEGMLLQQTNQGVVQRQIAYAHQRGVPWGISEAGYYQFDAQQNYQYQGFGVPGLGRKRGLEDDLVVAPYASLLALPIDARAVAQNLQRLIEEGMLGHFGLYEAADYTPIRLPLNEEKAIVRSYMAHHQGMILVALTNQLQDDALVAHFHADPRIQSVELLLQEQLPQVAPVEEVEQEPAALSAAIESPAAIEPWHAAVDAPFPQAHLLSNGRYSLVLTSAGAGYGTWGDLALTRWRADTTCEDWGTWIYVQEEGEDLWSATLQPVGALPAGEARFGPDYAEFRRHNRDLTLATEVIVVPGDDVEIRRLTLTNHRDAPRRLFLTSYAEVVLAEQDIDRRHPAFNKMFVESEFRSEENLLLFRRRPRSADESLVHLVHTLALPAGMEPAGAFETDRARFLGRHGSLRAPAALQSGQGLSGTTGCTLDPILALGQELEVGPRERVVLAYVTAAADEREQALALAGRYQSLAAVERAFQQASARAEAEVREMDLTADELRHAQQLLSALLYPGPALRAQPETLAENQLGQAGLWPYSISGDYPLLLARVGSQEEAEVVQELLRIHSYWRKRRLQIDLVILNLRDPGYSQELQEYLRRLVRQTGGRDWLNRRGGIFLLAAGHMDRAAQTLLAAASRVVLDGDGGTMEQQLAPLRERPTYLPPLVPTGPSVIEAPALPPVPRPDDLEFDNGMGGFARDGREYVLYLEPGQVPPAPWVNVIANPQFGCLVSEAGLGFSWAANSGENRLTPWNNDPVRDPPAEALYLRDEETGEIWSPTPQPAGEKAPYLVRHGQGYSVFEHNSHGLSQRLRVFVARDAPLKVVQFRVENHWERVRRITVTFYAEWVLHVNRDQAQQYVVPEYVADRGALLARNTYNAEFGARVAFAATGSSLHGVTADRTEFLGRRGNLACPAALGRVGLGAHVVPGIDPCAALQVHLDLPPGAGQEVFFLLGQGEDRDAALALLDEYRQVGRVEAAWEESIGFWEGLLGSVQVCTPDRAMDLLLNRWLIYQNLSCRIWGRSAFYQSSGAYGFRDQLQDAMAMLHAAPQVARQHILRAARYQFEAGDVLHWWHPPSGRGVRTRITDDLLWLPYVVAEYVQSTGDRSILDQEVSFLQGEPLGPDEHERYGHYERVQETHSLYEHCLRALDRGTTSGPHGLPLMGAGDWNDGMNRVGIEGRGESIWLGWFLYATLNRFADLVRDRDGGGDAARFSQRAEALRAALGESGWDGSWYRRAYFDDGTPLGSSRNRECQIDSIAQSWAVISGGGKSEQAAQAMAAVARRLVREDDRLLLLFTPPFDRIPRDPGYIKGYPPGVRENGGQYTHAALWAVWAWTKLGDGDRAGALLRLLNPIYHAETPEKAARYRVEPYVMAADVYGEPPHVGRGGWTWYTGSGGWAYRLGLEAILGVRRAGDRLRIEPCIPAGWSGYELDYRFGEALYHISVENPEGVNGGMQEVTLDGEAVSGGGGIPLADDGREHTVRVRLVPASPPAA
jgi:cyclic beta-1,2-glucan synthetase